MTPDKLAAGSERCPACGASLECGMRMGRDHCWCAELPPLAAIEPGRSCLCPACLKAALSKESRRAGSAAA